MATDAENTIIIGSDDESDNDDVVLIKEEIEVDSDDVIFLSETKAPPKLENVATSVPSTPCEAKPLTRSLSISTGTGKLSLQDDSDSSNLSLNDIPQLTDLQTNSVNPLDLSAKSCDTTSQSKLVTMTMQDLSVPQHGSDNVLQNQSVQAHSSVDLFDSTDNGKDSSSICRYSFASLNSLCNSGSSKSLPLLPSGDSNMQVFTNKDSVTGVASNSNVGCETNQGFNLNLDIRTSQDTMQLSNSSNQFTTVISTSSTRVSPFSMLFSDQSNGMVTVPVAHSNKLTSDDPYATSHFLLSSLDKCWQQVPIGGNNTALTSSSADLGANVFQSTSQTSPGVQHSGVVTTQASSDAFQCVTSSSSLWLQHSTISTIDLSGQNPALVQNVQSPPMDLTLVKHTSDSGSDAGSGSMTVSSAKSSVTPVILCGAPTSSPPSGSVTNVPAASTFSSLSDNLSPKSGLQANKLDDLNNSNASTPDANQSQFMFQMYNPLTLPHSMQQPNLSKSPAVTTSKDNAKASITRSSSKSNMARSFSPTHGSFSLPLKKQRRQCSSEFYVNVCTSCKVSPTGETFSKCPNGHAVCPECLKERVKLVLAGKTKECVKCLNRSCDSFYAISELKMSLPPMVVEILEDKLDQDYVDYISDMMLRKASSDTDSDDLDSMETRERESRKRGEYPSYWSDMEESDVNKNGYEMVPLEENSPEYENVVFKFFESMVDHNVEITDVYRVQNPIQWKYFTVRKTEMLQENQGYGGVAEEQLFHGTSLSVVEAICRKGFDWRVCGKHGTLYGQGSYFARNASYSHQYTDLKQGQRTPRRSSLTFAPLMSMGPGFPNPLLVPSVPSFNMCPHRNIRPSLSLRLVNRYTYLQTPTSSSSSTPSTSSSSSSASSMLMQPSPSGSSGHQAGTSPGLSGPTFMPILSASRQNLNSPSVSGQPVTKKFQVLPKPVPVKNIFGLPSNQMFSETLQQDVPKARMFLARVLVGKFVGGSPKLRKPPPLCPKEDPYGKCYDSCVDDVNNPKIFVIFDSNQAYPEYLIEYSYVQDSPKY